MSSAGAAPRAAVPVSSPRAEASRRNGAKSRGPRTPEGKARSARNALKHGLRAEKYVVLPEEDAVEFAALEAALAEELAPRGALQGILVGRIARAAWRLERAERIEVELFAERLRSVRDGGVGLALIRDGNGTRSFDTLLRYRGAALAELMRSLRTLKAVQAEQAPAPLRATKEAPAPVLMFEPKRRRAGTSIEQVPEQGEARPAAREKHPIEPEARANPCEFEPAPPADNREAPAAGPRAPTERTQSGACPPPCGAGASQSVAQAADCSASWQTATSSPSASRRVILQS
jgi:hypothetical protein